VISGLPLFLHSRLATIDESPASDSNSEMSVKDSKQTERIQGAHSLVIPFTLEENWLFARVGQECMRWTSAKLMF
jgi:hypothetical protein